MDEEGAVNNVNRNNEEKIKQKKKDKKSKKSAMDAEEAHNAGTVKANESISGVKRDQKKDKEKKKKNKTKGAKDPEADMKEGSSKGESFVVSDENDDEGKTDNAERNGESSGGLKSDHAERKRKRREKKDDKEKSKMQDTEEVKRDVASTDLHEEERVSVKESATEGNKEKKKKKKQKVKKDDIKDTKVGEKGGEVGESRLADATEVRKERKKEKRKSKGERVVELKDTYNENKCDEADLSSKKQESEKKKKKKKKHKKEENSKDDLSAAQQEHVDNGTDTLKETQNDEAEPTNRRKKKKGQFGNGSNDDQVNEAEHANKGKKRKSSLVVNGSDNTSPNKSNKKVRFSDQNEVFPPDLVKGKRFTPEEDQIVLDAVYKYIEENDLGDEGVEMILNCGKHRALRGCWKDIASSIPYRPYLAIYFRARILLMRSESRKWTQEEYDMIKEYQEKHGNKWKPLADELGKHAWHVKDTWRRIKLPNMNKGHWSQEEYQRLFDLVNTDLQLKISEEKKSKHGMLRDNICWTAISEELETRAQAMCCRKWYKQLTSPMVAEGVWADSDDYRLLGALYSLDATCMEDVEWDDLIDNRSGEVCRKRWNQMVLHIGQYGNKSFAEQVEVLAERYCPHLLEAREIWDNKPRVP